jgi:S1-C subfamily serine protease
MNASKLLLVVALSAFSINISTGAPSAKQVREVADHLQDVSVTIKSNSNRSSSEGSGAMIIREIDGKKVTFVWTAAHVVDNLRNVRSVIEKGSPRKIVEFDDASIVKELVEKGRRVGEMKMDAKVIKYSNADDGHDLALLMVRATDYAKEGVEFNLSDANDGIVPIGTSLFHVGSLLGQMGANSMTTGIISQVGRTLDKYEYDQTTVTAFPGSSGGGVYLQNGKYVGMIVRGAGEGFNLMVPVRRMIRWTEKNNILWAIDPKEEMPSMEDILGMQIEDSGIIRNDDDDGDDDEYSVESAFPYRIKTEYNFNDKLLNGFNQSNEFERELKTRPFDGMNTYKIDHR